MTNTANNGAGEIMRLGDLPLGSKIMTQNINDGQDMNYFWTIVSQDHNAKDLNYPINATTLLSDHIVDKSGYVGSGKPRPNRWEQSKVREILNGVFFESFEQNIKDNMLYVEVTNYSYSSTHPSKIIIPTPNEIAGSSGELKKGFPFDYQPSEILRKYVPEIADRINGINRDFLPDYWTRLDRNQGNGSYLTEVRNWQGSGSPRFVELDRISERTLGIRPILNIHSDMTVYEHPTDVDTYTLNPYTIPTEPSEPVEPEMEWQLTYEEDFLGSINFDHVNDPDNPWTFKNGHIQSGNLGIPNSKSTLRWNMPTFKEGSVVQIEMSMISHRSGDRLRTYFNESPTYSWELAKTFTETPYHLYEGDKVSGPIEVTESNKFLFTSRNSKSGIPIDFAFETDDFYGGLEDAHVKIHAIRIYEYLEKPPFTEGTLADAPVDTKIKIGELGDGSDILFNISSKDHYLKDTNYPANTVTLLSESSIYSMEYHNEGLSGDNTYKWELSSIRNWLNSIFYNSLPDAIKLNIMDTVVETRGEYIDSVKTVTDKIFIPSVKEVGQFSEYYPETENPGFGEPINSVKLNINKDYWLREPFVEVSGWFSDYYYQIIDDNGVYQKHRRNSREPVKRGIRPLMNISNTLEIKRIEGSDIFEFKDVDLPVDLDDDAGKIKNNYIHILNSETFEIDHVIDNYESFSMTINYNDVGDFIAQIDNRLDNAKYLLEDRIILFGGSNRLMGVITSVDLSIDNEGNEIRVVRGRTIGHILSYRLVESTTKDGRVGIRYTGRGEDLIKEVVRKNFIDTAPERVIDGFDVDSSNGLGEFLYGDFLYDNILDITNDVTQSQGLGWNIVYDEEGKRIIFDVYEGRNLSISQEENPPVLLSVDLGNLASQSYLYEGSEEKNFLYAEIYSSLWSDSPSTWGSQGDTTVTGINRKEDYTKIDLYQPNLITPTNPDYAIPAETQMQWHLDKTKPLETLDAVVIDKELFEFGVDYDLGDIITINNGDWKVEADMRVTSMTVESDAMNNDLRVMLSFGSQIPRITDRIKSEIEKHDPNEHSKERVATTTELKDVEKRLRNLIG